MSISRDEIDQLCRFARIMADAHYALGNSSVTANGHQEVLTKYRHANSSFEEFAHELTKKTL